MKPSQWDGAITLLLFFVALWLAGEWVIKALVYLWIAFMVWVASYAS